MQSVAFEVDLLLMFMFRLRIMSLLICLMNVSLQIFISTVTRRWW